MLACFIFKSAGQSVQAWIRERLSSSFCHVEVFALYFHCLFQYLFFSSVFYSYLLSKREGMPQNIISFISVMFVNCDVQNLDFNCNYCVWTWEENHKSRHAVEVSLLFLKLNSGCWCIWFPKPVWHWLSHYLIAISWN